MNTLTHWTAFQDHQQFASGDPWDVAVVVSRALQQQPGQNIYIFDDQTGRMVDIDLTISPAALMAQLQTQYAVNETAVPEALRGAGRPKLGVVAREVTLLPRHWEWLATQPSGASATLRKLVEQARKQDQATVAVRQAQEATDRFMNAMLGNAPGYEAAARALYTGQKEDFLRYIEPWPTDLRNYVQRLAEPAFGTIKAESEQ
ncbi:DUF2239 family protein [Alkanindiges illinoisensis]|uniref:DUF2239 family protein n=1 Tax=Alkanindiges illinoisensis TaxID=197183 RepID=UPI00047A0D68|nr:DUF2239 family protein [Alkanindiges illinoisensis]